MNIQQEVRVLNSSVELITSYVNYGVCCFPEDKTELVRTVLPQNSASKKYFLYYSLRSLLESIKN